MKTIVAFALLLAVAVALPHERRSRSSPNDPYEVVVVKETPHNNIGIDGYRFDYHLSDGQTREESAQVETRGAEEDAVLRVRGSYSFVAPDGQIYTVTYIADENGFQPQGAHLPAV